jgi:peptidoglycan/LPS O-acetylase OafA/YrhL
MVVFFGHLSGDRFTGGLFWQFELFTHEAVAVFFVLSGFVIAYSADRPGVSVQRFVIERMARLYSVVLPALVITLVLDNVGRAINPVLYSNAWGYEPSNLHFLASAFFIDELWWSHITPGSMLSFWSLGFEVIYYIIFGIAFFSKGILRAILLAVTALVAGPMILMMLPMWLLGTAAYHVCKRVQMGQHAGLATWGLTLALWAVYEVKIRLHIPTVPMRAYPALTHVLSDYIVALLFSINVIGFQATGKLTRALLEPVEPVIRYAAGATFTIYLLHLPFAQFFTTIVRQPPSALSTRLEIFGGTLMALFLVASVTERQKGLWRRGIIHCYCQTVATMSGRRRIRRGATRGCSTRDEGEF